MKYDIQSPEEKWFEIVSNIDSIQTNSTMIYMAIYSTFIWSLATTKFVSRYISKVELYTVNLMASAISLEWKYYIWISWITNEFELSMVYAKDTESTIFLVYAE